MMIMHQVLHARYYCCTLCMFHLYYFAHTSNADRQVITLCANEHLSAPTLFIAGMKCACQSRSLVCVSFLIVLSQLLNFAGGSYLLSAGCFTTLPALSKSFVFITLTDKQPSCGKQNWREEGAYFAGQVICGGVRSWMTSKAAFCGDPQTLLCHQPKLVKALVVKINMNLMVMDTNAICRLLQGYCLCFVAEYLPFLNRALIVCTRRTCT